jgi:hypothetical protein
VPAQTCIVSLGAIANMPIEITRWLSNTGRHVTPLLIDFQIPPPAAAAKNVFDGDGMPVTSEIRPIVFAGPIFRQRKPAMVVESSSMGLDGGAEFCAATVDVSASTARSRTTEAKIERRMSGGGRAGGVG